MYESSAIFIRYDPSAMREGSEDSDHVTMEASSVGLEAPHFAAREFLFFGDVESEWRKEGEEHKFPDQAKSAKSLCVEIWKEAATSWKEGRLAGIFVSPTHARGTTELLTREIECSYDSARPAHLMFGHVSPPGVYHELTTLALLVGHSNSST